MKPHIAIIRSAYRPEIVGKLVEGAVAVLSGAGATFEEFEVSGSLEIPAAVSFLIAGKKKFDGYVTLGCVLKGDTIHDEVIAYTIFPSLDKIARKNAMPIGNGVLTVNTVEQAVERADRNQQDRGGEAAKACLRMWELKQAVGA